MLAKFINWMKPLPDAQRIITDEKQIVKQYKSWRIKMFSGMFIGYLVFYLNRKNLSAVSPYIVDQIGVMGYAALGSAMAVTYGIGKFFSGIFTDKCNIKAFMAFGLICSSVIGLFFGFLTSAPLMMFFRGLSGAFQSMGFPPTAKGVVYWFSQNERGTIWTLISASKTLGATLILWIASLCVFAGDWRAVFYIPAILGIVCGIVMLLTMTDKPSTIGLPPVEVFRNDITVTKKKEVNFSQWQLLKKYVFTNSYLWFVAIGAMFLYYVRFTTLDWAIKFMVDTGLSRASAPSLLAFMPVAGVLGGVSAGWMSDKFFKGRCVPISLIYLVFLLGSIYCMYHFITIKASYLAMAMSLSAVGFFLEGPQSVAMGVLVTRITLQESVGAAIGFVGIFEYAGTFLAGLGAGMILLNYSWPGVFSSCSVAVLVTMVLISLIFKKDAQGYDEKL
ncbi:MAG: MFS transporter [Endomicrobium sp.]|jgi:sugar phosphate permease|nr:MFS transporter [Endomicrobium sp.]